MTEGATADLVRAADAYTELAARAALLSPQAASDSFHTWKVFPPAASNVALWAGCAGPTSPGRASPPETKPPAQQSIPQTRQANTCHRFSGGLRRLNRKAAHAAPCHKQWLCRPTTNTCTTTSTIPHNPLPTSTFDI